jgi:hypothetical protein
MDLHWSAPCCGPGWSTSSTCSCTRSWSAPAAPVRDRRRATAVGALRPPPVRHRVLHLVYHPT